jgi:Spy/CpxP family protein refolding chaperone
MRKFLISVALVTTAFTAVPAMAQPGYGHGGPGQHQGPNRPGPGGGWNQGGPSRQQINELLRDLDRAESGIQRSVQRRVISQREALGLRREAVQIRGQLNRASRNGINNREFLQLRNQVNRLEQRLRVERNDRDGRRN